MQSLLYADILRVTSDIRSFIVMYSAICISAGELHNSAEHDSVRFFALHEMPRNLPSLYLRGINMALKIFNCGGY